MPFRTLSRISRERSGAEQNPSVGNLVSPYRMCPASFSFSRLDGAEITLFPWHLQEYSPLRLLPWCWIISAILIGPGHASIMLGWCIVLTYIIILFIIWKLNSRHWRFTFLILKLKQPCPQIFISIFSKNSISIKTALEIVFKIMLLTEIFDL